jgi:peptidyl-prolyl cis-trans isomerase D
MLLQKIRDRATSWIAYIIVGLLVVSFAIWGIGSYVSEPGQRNVAEVGDVPISQREFQQTYQQQRSRLQNMFGDRFDPTLFDDDQLKRNALQQLINEQLLMQVAQSEGLRVGDQQLQQAILSHPAFQRDGAFDPELYQRALRSQGYSDVMFEESLRSSLVTQQLQEGITASSLVTPEEMDRYAELMTQQRELEYAVLPLSKYKEQVTVDEAAIEGYFQEHQDQFMNPEQVKLEYLELTLEDMAEEVSIGEDEVQAAYEQQLNRYTQPEERGASHILVSLSDDADAAAVDKARARAQEIYDAIEAGTKTFQQTFEEFQEGDVEGVEVQELGAITKGMLEPEFENALYTLETTGDVSAPVQTSFGFHIVRLDNVVDEKVKGLDEVRDELIRELRLSQLEDDFYELAETLSNLSYENPDSLEPAARELDLQVLETQWVTRSSQEGITAFPNVLEAAFSEDVLSNGLNSDAIEVEPNHVIVIRAKEYQEATPKTLDQAREAIVQQLRDTRAREAMNKEAEDLRARAAAGEDLRSLGETFGLEIETTGAVGRNDNEVDRALLEEAFRLPAPAEGEVTTGTAALTNGDRAVVVVKNVVAGNKEHYPEAERKSLAQRLTQQAGAVQFQGLLDSLRSQTKIVIYDDRL